MQKGKVPKQALDRASQTAVNRTVIPVGTTRPAVAATATRTTTTLLVDHYKGYAEGLRPYLDRLFFFLISAYTQLPTTILKLRTLRNRPKTLKPYTLKPQALHPAGKPLQL